MIQEFAKFIETKTSFQVGTTLQIGPSTTESPDRCSVILDSVGGPVYFEMPKREDAIFQVISRAKTHLTARKDAWEIYKAIHGAAGYDLPIIISGKIYKAWVISAMARPQYIGKDEKARFEYSTNYIIRGESV